MKKFLLAIIILPIFFYFSIEFIGDRVIKNILQNNMSSSLNREVLIKNLNINYLSGEANAEGITLLNKRFEIPFITSKIAISNDYQTINKNNKWITNKNSRKLVHLLRNKYDCIFSTSRTINNDNSLLNCRIDGLDNNKPDLFIISVEKLIFK